MDERPRPDGPVVGMVVFIAYGFVIGAVGMGLLWWVLG